MDPRVQAFSSSEALRFGWDHTRTNLKPLLILGVLNGLLSIVNRGMFGEHGSVLGSLVIQLAQVATGLVFLRVLIQIHDGHPVDLGRLGPMLRGFVPYLVATALLGLLVGGGLILLIVPGVLWALRYGLAPMLVADQGREPLEAFQESSRLTEGARTELFTFALLCLGVNLLGALALGVGLLLTVPTTGLAAVSVYRALQARAAGRPQFHAPTAGPSSPLVAS